MSVFKIPRMESILILQEMCNFKSSEYYHMHPCMASSAKILTFGISHGNSLVVD